MPAAKSLQPLDRVVLHDFPNDLCELGAKLAAFDFLTHAHRHLCGQYAYDLTRSEAQSNLDARVILLNAREAVLTSESRPFVGDLIDSLVYAVEKVERKQ